MPTKHSGTIPAGSAQPRPCLIVGAGGLTAAVWKIRDEQGVAQFHFNIFSWDSADGTVTQRFSPHDVIDLARLAHVLAAALVEDGCVEHDLRRELQSLRTDLETIFCLGGE